ncbi:glycoside hydrolase family 1 protein [Spiroplasma melliferum]|uniref:glycoside hydrolase family 1 protein n=1 Tax=Spiroplasma melliferum TaxID=2134 RepID=UPI0002A622BD|nr:glycoside hydrolase family 1 protein [Spiroplasma melliferum]ELL44520.1 aryl-phospho-beta-d-glucosidase [Spiroplasma melliferum IPMB4A]
MIEKKFIFAASTCAFQIEGGRSLGGRTESIWDEFTKRNFSIPPLGKAEREINSIEVAADFYSKYKTDARIMKRMGLQGLVYNMDWTRIFPKNSTDFNPEGIKFYDDVFKTLVENGIKPIPILYHWDTPMWAEIQGGFENRNVIEWFRNYVRVVFQYLGKYSNLWFVNDENSTFTLDAYLNDYLPPAKNDKTAFAKAIHHLNLSAAIAKEEFDLAKSKGYLANDALLGIYHDWAPPYQFREGDQAAVEKYNGWFKNFFLDPNLKGTYPDVFFQWLKDEKINFMISDEDLNLLKKHQLDLIGWNYYRPCYITGDNYVDNLKELHQKSHTFFVPGFKQVFPKGIEYTKWNWIIDPKMLATGAEILWKEYQKPLMIIENGMGDFDDKAAPLILDQDRIRYLSLHLAEVFKALERGVNLIGYSLWTYCDIFSPSGGYRKDYGLVSVDFNSKIKTRTPKLSYVWYKRVITTNGKNLAYDDIDVLTNLLKTELTTWDFWYQ